MPAYFGPQERRATIIAALLAGWDEQNIELLNEDVAAFYAFNLDRIFCNQEIKNDTIVFIFKLDGGTLDCSIFKYERESSKMLETPIGITKGGDSKLGGDDFDEKIFNWVAAEHLKEEGVDIKEDVNAKAEVMKAVRKAKEALSRRKKKRIIVDLKPPVDLTLTRDKFNELCEELYQRIEIVIDETLETKHAQI